jgi:eukaryotic-like serine/threonine-protein kinase
VSLDAGTRLGPYTIVSLLGRGGMGEVYRARDERLGRDVAVKVLPAELTADPDRRSRLDREARAAAALNHPNIVAIHDIGAEADVPYVVCELLEGRTLRAILDEKRIAPERVVDYARQIARGLAAAHETGLVHRDIKPENLFVTRQGTVKILDFGLARTTSIAASGDATTVAGQTGAGVLLGTAGYMAPEQVRGEPIDQRADVFSFGAVLYEMAAGRRAFAGDSAIASLTAILTSEVPLERLGDVFLRVAPVIRRCLAKERDARFASAAEVAFALDHLDAPATSRGRGARLALVGAVAAATLAGVVWIGWTRSPAAAPPPNRAPHSIAVLPLANLSGDAGQEYFADGVTEALIGNLARIHGLRVISRTSVMTYKSDTSKSARQIARELQVDALVEGTVVRAGSQVKIDAQLIDAAKDAPIWSQTYESSEQNVITLERDVTRAIAAGIKATLTPAEMARMQTPATVNPAAHEAYLKGRYALNTFTEAELHEAIDDFSAALKEDPSYAPAYAGIADAYTALRGIWVDPRVIMPRARAAAEKAIALDDSLAEAHVSNGAIKLFYDFDWDGSAREFETALALNPNLADAHHQNALRLAAIGRPKEAIAEIRLAEDLDPLSAPIMADVAWIYYCARDYTHALESARRAETLDPQFWFGLTILGLAYEKNGDPQNAITTLERARRMEASPLVLEMLGGAYAVAGQTAKARAVLADLRKMQERRYVCPYEVATVYAGLGDKAHALEWLKMAHDQRADCTPWLNVDAKFDSLRAEPAFMDLARMMGFKP